MVGEANKLLLFCKFKIHIDNKKISLYNLIFNKITAIIHI